MQSMIKQMCKNELTDSDIKAICKTRGFPADGATSRDIFENFYISTMGVKEALNSLTYEETIFLHLLNKINNEVDIEYFERLYGWQDLRAVMITGLLTNGIRKHSKM
jgi:hypothetical protein